MSGPTVHQLWAMYAALGMAFLLIGAAIALAVAQWLRERKWRRREKRYGGYVTDELIRRVRFFDDQADPWDLIQ